LFLHCFIIRPYLVLFLVFDLIGMRELNERLCIMRGGLIPLLEERRQGGRILFNKGGPCESAWIVSPSREIKTAKWRFFCVWHGPGDLRIIYDPDRVIMFGKLEKSGINSARSWGPPDPQYTDRVPAILNSAEDASTEHGPGSSVLLQARTVSTFSATSCN
jgi:hypothetical protein